LERRQKHPAQRVAESHSEAALERLGDEHGAAANVAPAHLLLERAGLLQFLPVFCVDGHFHPLAVRGWLEPLVKTCFSRFDQSTTLTETLDAAPLGRTDAVVRDRRDVADRSDLEANRLERPKRAFAARSRTLDLDLEGADAMFGGLLAGVLGGDLRRVGKIGR